MCFKKKKNYIFEEDLYKNNKAPLFSESDYANEEEAHLNPFINKCEYQKSIEEYSVKYQKNIFSKEEDVYLGSVLRNDYISKKKKWKTFKKYLKNIKKDYKEHIEKLEDKKRSNQLVYETFKIKKLSKLMKIFIVVAFITNLIITITMKLFFEEIFSKLLFNGLTIFGYLLVFIFLIYTFIHKRRYRNINNIQKRYNKKLNKYFRVEKRTFKKYYQMLYRYYYKNIFSNNLYYEAKDLNLFWESKYSYAKALENSENIEDNIRKLAVIQKRYEIIKRIFVVITVVNILVLLYMIISNLL